MTDPTPRSETDINRHSAQRLIRKNADRLRELADTYDRIAAELDRVPSAGYPNHVQVATQTIHQHATWLANAHLETAIGYAADADGKVQA